MNGYVEFFEPDFLVEAEPGLATSLGYDEVRILQLDDMLRRNGDRDHRGVGLDVLDLYRKLYRQDFQFVRRHPQKVLDVSASRTMGSFAACVFGAFPRQDNLSYFHAAFRDAFDPESVSLDSASFEEIYRNRENSVPQSTALAMGSAHLDVDFNDHRDMTLFVLDATQPKDLLDFWNYRAVHRDVWAIPMQWLEAMSAFCKNTIARAYKPLPGNPNGVMMHITTMFSRSIAEEQIQPLYAAYMQTDIVGANVLQTWYPPIWRPTPEWVSRSTRPTIIADRRSGDSPLDEQSNIRFAGLDPEFAERFGGKYRWANVVRMKDWSSKERIATIFPTDVRLSGIVGHQPGLDLVLSTTEGLVAFPRFKDHGYRWTMSDGATAISRWFESNGIKANISEAGKPTQQIIQTLEGFYGVGALAHEGVVRTLEHMARTPITRSAHWQEFKSRIGKSEGRGVWRNSVFKTLVERNAVELGYELKCPKCGSWSWHKLSLLGAELTCDLCLRQFAFPAVAPSNSSHARWAYRVIGPFALPNYAEGGYAAALAIRFLGSVADSFSGSDITWSGGQNLTLEDGTKVEIDLVVWYQRKEMFGTDRPTEIVFGEAKSFGKVGEDIFLDVDVDRMKRLAMRFPGSICVFATLKDGAALTRNEVARIRKFAEWGREYNRDRRQTRAPVILLTGTELFAAHDLSHAWKEKGGRHAELIAPAYVSTERLTLIADFTQQLYLGMPSYHDWTERRWEARRASKQSRTQKQSPRGVEGASTA